MDIDPKIVLAGATPRLLDEWQEYPQIWNYVRREVDERSRFSAIRMRSMSTYEKGWSSGEVRGADSLRLTYFSVS